jgi:hypothetical protein
MKAGDLVKCRTVGDGATGIVVEYFKVSGLYGVMLTRNNRMCAFQPQHLELISAGR